MLMSKKNQTCFFLPTAKIDNLLIYSRVHMSAYEREKKGESEVANKNA